MQTTTTLIARLGPAVTLLRAHLDLLLPATLAKRTFGAAPCRVPMPVPIPLPRAPRVASWMAAGLALGLPALAGATHPAQFEQTADGRLIDVQVRVEGRGTVPLYMAPGRFDRRYFQAFQGRNYSLVLRNNSGRRVGVLLAVDGLNAISGSRSSLSRHESMYVLDPFESAVIRGWRTSLNQVRRFVFVDEERSYAERTGQANGDLGWIRVLAFREQRSFRNEHGKIRTWELESDEYGAREDQDGESRREAGDAKRTAPTRDGLVPPTGAEELQFHGQRDAAPESSPGTGWGREQWDRVERTSFLAEAAPVDRISLRYEYASGLRALGIRLWRPNQRLHERERGELGFAQPPRR